MKYLIETVLALLVVGLTFLGAKAAAEEAIPLAPLPEDVLGVQPVSFDARVESSDDEQTADCTACGEGCGGTCCCSTGCCGCGPAWCASIDALFITRSTALPRPLATLNNVTLMNVGDLQFANEAGLGVQLVRQSGRGWDLDVGFSMIDWWSTSRSVTGTGILAPGPYAVTFGGGAEVVARYGSSLYSTEIGLRKQGCCWLTPFGGFRWIELHEDFALTMPETTGGFLPGTVHGTNADNHLYGFQLGANGLLMDRGCLRLEGVINAGIYGNHADHDTFAFVEQLGFIEQARGQTSRAAFVGELKLAGKYQISDGLAVRGGYQLMWIDGVALAPNQFYSELLTADTATVHTEATPLYHGAFVGVEVCR